METNKVQELVTQAAEFTDQEVSELVDSVLKAHKLALNPQIVINLVKLQDTKPSFDDVKKETN